MMLPEGFLFNQSNLQDYLDCPRRFQLRHLEHRAWPASQTASALESERRMRLGHAFHRLMRQLHSGVSPELLQPVARTEAELSAWWDNYLSMPPRNLPRAFREPELTLGVGLGAHRLEARYDLLAGEPGGRFVIVDWKTSAHRTQRHVLQDRVQTRVYPWVLVSAGASLNAGVPIAPQQAEMVYWFAEFPGQPERFAYDPERQAADGAFLAGLLQEIESRPPDGFSRTQDQSRCKYCVYSSLCWEESLMTQWPEAADAELPEPGFDEIDLESVVPIPF